MCYCGLTLVFLRAGVNLNNKIKLQSIVPVNFEYTVYRTNCPPSLEANVDPLVRAILNHWAQ